MISLLKHKYAKLIISAGIVVFCIIFMILTAAKPAPNEKSQTTNNDQPGSAAKTNTNTGLDANINAAINANKPKPAVKKTAAKPSGFTEKKTPHFVSATIANNATLTQAPNNLTLTFDTALAKNTQTMISVKKDDITSVTMTSSTINDKTLAVRLNAQVTNGDYYVYYVACFADVGCKDGQFGYHLKLPQ